MRSYGRSGMARAAWIAILVWLLVACAGGDGATQVARPVLVAQPTAATGGVRTFAGDVRAREQSPLSFRVGGNVLERRVDVGDHVNVGDVLALLDSGDLQAQARAAQAQLVAAEAELGRARADQARFAQLAQDQLVSRSTIDAQNAAATAAQAQVSAARADMTVARNQAGYTQLRAPADGVIAARSVEAGEVVGAGQTVFTLASDGAREVAFAVPEGAIGSIRPGQPVMIELWSQPGQRWPGRIREISPAADPASRTYAARVTVDAPEGALELGQSARVLLPGVPGGNGKPVLSVPLSALQQVDGGVAVFVVDPATSELRSQPVEIGRYGQARVPVKSGLDADDWVVAAGGHLLRAGQKVSPVDRDNRPVALAPVPGD